MVSSEYNVKVLMELLAKLLLFSRLQLLLLLIVTMHMYKFYTFSESYCSKETMETDIYTS